MNPDAVIGKRFWIEWWISSKRKPEMVPMGSGIEEAIKQDFILVLLTILFALFCWKREDDDD
jgi:hypothetical protein